ncbi:MAG: ribosome small subunit-dependent GTPase A [Myxococcaceae bacterium]|nr:MAG: ribosome small subunit-dependent GTPase A [Myxococcaceae bacterium]
MSTSPSTTDPLVGLGWTAELASSIGPDESDLQPARVAASHGIAVTLWTREGVRNGPLAAALSEPPAVGDWVLARAPDLAGDWAVQRLLPRRTQFVRHASGQETRAQVIAANIDRVLVATGLDGDFNHRRLERYLLALATSGAATTLVLTKADQCSDVAGYRRQAEALAPTVVVSARTGEGVDSLRALIPAGSTVALVGSSGVGKSTLVNALMGGERASTGAVRSFDNKGRHTTTHREMFVVPGAGVVVDTPGMRGLEPWADDGTLAALDAMFHEVSEAALGCRFTDCDHMTSPDCAVREGVRAGTLAPERVRSWVTLRAELDQQAVLRAERAAKLALKAKKGRRG